ETWGSARTRGAPGPRTGPPSLGVVPLRRPAWPAWSPCASGVRAQRLSHGGPTALEGADIARQHARGKEDNHRTPQVKDAKLLACGEGLWRGVDRIGGGAPGAAPGG